MTDIRSASSSDRPPFTPPATRAIRKRIRVRKEDSAFVYFILESYEGVTAYSTLAFKVGDPNRNLELLIPPDFEGEVEALLQRLGGLVDELETIRPSPAP